MTNLAGVRTITDGLTNLVANLGTPRDKAAASFYQLPQLTGEQLWAAYRSAWLPRKIVDIPALDSCRAWRSWQADSKLITAIEAEETRLGLQQKLLEAQIKARLLGGSAIYISTGEQDPSKPLNPERVKKGGIKHLTVLSKRLLHANSIELDPDSPYYGKPASYNLSAQTRQVTIHPSRLAIFVGAPVPEEDLATGPEQGWGDSVLTAIMDQIKQADGTSANVASLIFEAKVDVLRIPELMSKLASDTAFEQQLLDRLALAAMAKGINGMLVLDKEEEYEQKQAQFGSLRDLVLVFMQLVSGAADIPMTRLLGQSPAGMSATGESDIRNYYDRIASMQSLVLTPALANLDECLVRSALGNRPDDVFYNWRSLWQTSEKERADIGKVVAESIKVVNETKLIPEEVMSKVAVNMLTEAGVAPGLESEMADYLAEHPEGEESEDDDLASMGVDPVLGPDGQPLDPEAAAAAAVAAKIADAAPRSLYVRRDVVNTAEIAAWAEQQGITDLVEGLHVTIAYSRQPIDWIKAGNAKEWGEDGKDQLVIAEGGPRAVEPLGGMSAVLLFASSQLTWRHADILRAGASYDWADYQPHVSLTKSPIDLSKVEPYRGRIVLGPEIFEELRED